MIDIFLSYGSKSTKREVMRERAAFEPLMKITGIFIATLVILFIHVWIPIQAERSLVQLKKIDSQLSLKKAELNELNAEYARLTSLSSLDQWAKKNGPWIPVQAQNVLSIQK